MSKLIDLEKFLEHLEYNARNTRQTGTLGIMHAVLASVRQSVVPETPIKTDSFVEFKNNINFHGTTQSAEDFRNHYRKHFDLLRAFGARRHALTNWKYPCPGFKYCKPDDVDMSYPWDLSIASDGRIKSRYDVTIKEWNSGSISFDFPVSITKPSAALAKEYEIAALKEQVLTLDERITRQCEIIERRNKLLKRAVEILKNGVVVVTRFCETHNWYREQMGRPKMNTSGRATTFIRHGENLIRDIEAERLI